MTIEEMLPSAGQGVLGIECRLEDEETKQLIAPLNHRDSYHAVLAERAMCRYLGGGCHLPIAAYAECQGEDITLRGLVANAKGTTIIRSILTGQFHEAEKLGTAVANDLLNQGAQSLVDIVNE
jgi:hydroxymethylbilane synthase